MELFGLVHCLNKAHIRGVLLCSLQPEISVQNQAQKWPYEIKRTDSCKKVILIHKKEQNLI